MSVRYPAHLFIRIDRPRRDALRERAAQVGVTVSALARRELTGALGCCAAERSSVGTGPKC